MVLSVFCAWTMMISASFVCGSVQHFNSSKELLQTLLKHYDRRLRPNLDQRQPTIVNVSFGIFNIEELDEVNSKFSVTGFLHMTWIDENINWDPEESHDIISLMFPATEVWYPVIVLGYAHGKAGNPVDDWMKVRIFYNGYAVLSPRDVFKSTCSADLTYYPFDIQRCSIVLLSWGFLEDEIRLQTPFQYVLADYFIEHGEWEIIENSTVDGYPIDRGISLNFKLRRKPLFYVVNIILPITMLSLLNMMVFALPPESGERVSYSITVLLAIAVFLTMVGDNLPKTAKPMPLLSFFLLINFITSTLTCVVTIMNLRIYHKNRSEPLSACVNSILRKLTSSSSKELSNLKTETEKHTDETIAEHSPADAASISKFEEEQQNFTWTDVSKLVDNGCMWFVLIVTVTNTVGFMSILSKQ